MTNKQIARKLSLLLSIMRNRGVEDRDFIANNNAGVFRDDWKDVQFLLVWIKEIGDGTYENNVTDVMRMCNRLYKHILKG